jgi:ribulose-5-phosphate 4-epimerase/fuculose-1-phosphate aldolase
MKGGLLPLTQQSMLFDGQISYHEYDHQTVGSEECEKLAADLGTNNAIVLHNHGLLTCAPTIAEAFTLLYNLENACKVQVDVLCSRVETILPKPDAVAKLAAVGGAGSNAGALEWAAVVRSLERSDPSFRS